MIHFTQSIHGDWVAMYIDGRKVAEGHSLNEYQVLDALGVPYTSEEVDDDPYQDTPYPEEL